MWAPERRVTERERAAVADQLSKACGEGLLSAETLEQRLTAALEAKRRFQLAALVSDLPDAHPVARVRAWLRRSGEEALPVLTPPPSGGSGPFVVGRQPSCDLWIDDKTISKHHADLVRTGDGWLLRDVGSRNGTRVNGWRIAEAVLHDGDVVQLGNMRFAFEER